MTRCQDSASRGTKSWEGLSVGAMVIDVDAPLLVLRTYVRTAYVRAYSFMSCDTRDGRVGGEGRRFEK